MQFSPLEWYSQVGQVSDIEQETVMALEKWSKERNTIPSILKVIEEEFRVMLGSEKRQVLMNSNLVAEDGATNAAQQGATHDACERGEN